MKQRKSSEERERIQNEALHRATAWQSLTNYPAIYRGFIEKGIAEDDIHPRINVFTYNAWKALGRFVRRGEHGVRVITFMTKVREREDGSVEEISIPSTSVVFHISQTEPINNETGARE